MAEDHDNPEASHQAEVSQPETEKVEIKTGQIPLLDDVVFNTELPFPKPKVKRPKPEQVSDENAPRPTDLFGGSPETAQEGPLSPQYEARDLDGLRTSTEQMVDDLVAEYSQEIVKRLREELTTLLDDLNENDKKPSISDPENPSEK